MPRGWANPISSSFDFTSTKYDACCALCSAAIIAERNDGSRLKSTRSRHLVFKPQTVPSWPGQGADAEAGWSNARQ